MEETSSKYVDRIVIEKIIEEKLSRVHHRPDCSFTEIIQPLYTDFISIAPYPDVHFPAEDTMVFSSPVKSSYQENNNSVVHIKSPQTPKASLIFIHGLYEDNREIHTFLLNGLIKAGYKIYIATLPYHYERKPSGSSFSGEYFWSANVQRSKQAFQQGVYELYQLYNLVKDLDRHPVYITAFSMGAGLALTLAALTDNLQGLFIINPVCSLSKVVWDSPLCQTIKKDLLDSGLTFEQIIKIYKVFEPASVADLKIARSKICLAYGLYDQITSREQYQGLKVTCQLTNVIEYHAGHQNILRVPRLAADIDTFFQLLAA